MYAEMYVLECFRKKSETQYKNMYEEEKNKHKYIFTSEEEAINYYNKIKTYGEARVYSNVVVSIPYVSFKNEKLRLPYMQFKEGMEIDDCYITQYKQDLPCKKWKEDSDCEDDEDLWDTDETSEWVSLLPNH